MIKRTWFISCSVRNNETGKTDYSFGTVSRRSLFAKTDERYEEALDYIKSKNGTGVDVIVLNFYRC